MRMTIPVVLCASLLAAHSAQADETIAPPVTVVPVFAPAATPAPPPPPTVVAIPGAVVTAAPGSAVSLVCPPTQVVVMPSAPAAACPAPTVQPQAASDEPPGPTTRLEFVSAGDEEEVIWLYNDDPDVYDYEAVCITPCAIDVRNGMREFRAGGYRYFTIYALGGRQRWRVEDDNRAGIVSGAVMVGLGAGVPFLAWATQRFSDPLDELDGSYASRSEIEDAERSADALYAVTGLGAGAFAVGLLLWIFSYGESEEMVDSDGYLSVSDRVGVLPSFYAGTDERGERQWGLGLGVRY